MAAARLSQMEVAEFKCVEKLLEKIVLLAAIAEQPRCSPDPGADRLRQPPGSVLRVLIRVTDERP
jgi:hypothetical protein